jgi:Trk K+ transport system NAD-binding subunit
MDVTNMPTLPRTRRFRQVKATWRDTWLLLREFSSPLLLFFIALIGGGLAYYFLARVAGEPLANPLEAIYSILSMTFLQANSSFPHAWYLGLFHFIMPVIGLILLAQGVTEFSLMLFNRRARGKEWEIAVASTFSNHIILVGLGHLGFRVASELVECGQEVVIIEANTKADLVNSARALGIPVIQDDATREPALESAGIQNARAVVLCTQNDSLNLKVALKARRLKPDIQVIVRIFDDDFARALHEQFGYTAFSATGMAAPAFAAAASGVDMTRPITVEGQSMSLAYIKVESTSQLINLTINDVEQKYNLSVVYLRHDKKSDFHPPADFHVCMQDVMAVLGGPGEIRSLARDNRPER